MNQPKSQEDIRGAVLNALRSIAPEADPTTLDPRADIRDALDIDSMDFLRFVVSVHEALHVDIPEVDYPKVRTLEGCLAYLDRTLKGTSP